MAQRSIEEAAQALSVTTAEIWRRIRRGELSGVRDGDARETRLLVDLPETARAESGRRDPEVLARELRGDVALLVGEMDAYREEADQLAQEREDVRLVLEGALADLEPLRAPTGATRDASTGADGPGLEAVPARPEEDAGPEAPAPRPLRPVESIAEKQAAEPATSGDEVPPEEAVAAVEARPAVEEAPVTGRPASRVAAAGVRLHYLEWAPAEPVATPPIVLIHGISGNARNYDALTAALAGRFHLYALDLRGHGDSGWDANRDYRVSALVYDLNLFLDSLGLEAVILVGTGLGADVALGLVSARPGMVRGLVLNDSGPEAGSTGLKRVLEAIREAPADFASVAEAMAWWREHYPSLAEYDDLVVTEFIHSTLREAPGGRLIWKFDPALREVDNLRDLRDIDLGVAVGRILCPTLIVRGEYSDVLSRDAARRIRGRVRGAVLVEAKGVAHAPALVERDVLPELESFLQSIGTEGPVAAS